MCRGKCESDSKFKTIVLNVTSMIQELLKWNVMFTWLGNQRQAIFRVFPMNSAWFHMKTGWFHETVGFHAALWNQPAWKLAVYIWKMAARRQQAIFMEFFLGQAFFMKITVRHFSWRFHENSQFSYETRQISCGRHFSCNNMNRKLAKEF